MMNPFITITTDGYHSEIYVNGQLVPHVKHFLIVNDEEGMSAKLILAEDCELDESLLGAIHSVGFIEVLKEIELFVDGEDDEHQD